MLKSKELADTNSCLNRARDDELIFVLLERDTAAPDTVRDWADRRVRSGKNSYTDEQISEALAWADAVEIQQRKNNVTSEHNDSGIPAEPPDPQNLYHGS